MYRFSDNKSFIAHQKPQEQYGQMLRVTLFSLLLSWHLRPCNGGSQGDGLTTNLPDRGIRVACTAANTSLRLTETEKLQLNAVQP